LTFVTSKMFPATGGGGGGARLLFRCEACQAMLDIRGGDHHAETSRASHNPHDSRASSNPRFRASTLNPISQTPHPRP